MGVILNPNTDWCGQECNPRQLCYVVGQSVGGGATGNDYWRLVGGAEQKRVRVVSEKALLGLCT